MDKGNTRVASEGKPLMDAEEYAYARLAQEKSKTRSLRKSVARRRRPSWADDQ